MSFTQAAPLCWRHTTLGNSARCLLVCVVDSSKHNADDDAQAGSSGVAAGYLLVQRPDAVRLLAVLLYAEKHSTASGGRRRWSLSVVVVVVYVVALFVQWVMNNRRWLRGWLGLPSWEGVGPGSSRLARPR
jgi:hypothetical protein